MKPNYSDLSKEKQVEFLYHLKNLKDRCGCNGSVNCKTCPVEKECTTISGPPHQYTNRYNKVKELLYIPITIKEI